MAALIMPLKECILEIEGYRADDAFDLIAIHLDAAIGQEDLKAVTMSVDVAKLLAELGFGGDAVPLTGQPLAEVATNGAALLLADCRALIVASAPDRGFELVDFAQSGAGPRRRFRCRLSVICHAVCNAFALQ
jgi:hypothetical protein